MKFFTRFRKDDCLAKKMIKPNILFVMKKFKGIEMTPSDIAREQKRMGLFVPYDNDVHIRQLFARKKIQRVKRGIYIYNTQENE